MKNKSILLVLIFLLISSIGHAAANPKIQISMNGNNLSVMQTSIVLNGKVISNKVPSFVHNDRTLVHIRFIEENSDAKVTWEQKTRTVVVAFEGKQVRLAIDSAIATIDGEKRILDKGSIPRLVKYEGEKDAKTMVPLSFLAEALGFEVGWDYENNNAYINSKGEEVKPKPENPKPEKPEINKDENSVKNIIESIGVFKGSTNKNKFIIKSDKKLNYITEYKKDTNQFIVDLKGSKLELVKTKDAPGTIFVDDNFIKEVRYSQLSYNPYVTRVVFNLKKYQQPSMVPKTDGTGLTISFESKKIGAITKENIAGKENIVIQGATKENMKIIKLNNPERFVIDLLDSTLEGETYKEYKYDLGFIKGLRVSQFTADNNYTVSDQIVRLVLDIKDGIKEPNIKIDALTDKIVIYPENSLWENIEYVSRDGNRILTIKNLINTSYSVDYDNTAKGLNIILPSSNTELNEGSIMIKDDLIDEIGIVKKGDTKEISIRFKKDINYTLLSKEIDNNISFSIENNKDLKPINKLIVIDAGHGGKDPGAVSPNKKNEKDFNLKVSQMFNEELKKLGYNTIMTRDKDVFIDLSERSRIANDNHADIFVSIHANAHGNGSIDGVQMLYCPATDSKVKSGDQFPFAEIMMNELLKGTGAYDRKIIKRPNLVVLKGTKMPAVLVEAGFLTNSKEEELLFTESYQKKIVDSLVSGVVKYFEMY